MTKKILSAIICVCVLFSVLACFASAAAVPTIDGTIPGKITLCPDTAPVLVAPEVNGNVYSEGWEIKVVGGDWIPYDEGTVLTTDYANGSIRYFAANMDGDYVYSNECAIVLAHNPSGAYKYDDSEHWRECVDCGALTDVGTHTTIDDIMSEKTEDNICTVCGHERAGFYNILVVLLNWIMSIVSGLIG